MWAALVAPSVVHATEAVRALALLSGVSGTPDAGAGLWLQARALALDRCSSFAAAASLLHQARLLSTSSLLFHTLNFTPLISSNLIFSQFFLILCPL